MTDQELQELRGWSAGLMGWRDHNRTTLIWINPDTHFVIAKSKWCPNDPTTGQIWMVVDRMRELGAYLRGLMYSPYTQKWTAMFTDVDSELGTAVDDNPCLAILKAAKATEDQC